MRHDGRYPRLRTVAAFDPSGDIVEHAPNCPDLASIKRHRPLSTRRRHRMGTMFAALRGRGALRPAPRGFVLIKGHKRPTMCIPASRPAGSWLHATPAVRAAPVLSCDASEALLGCGDEVAGGAAASTPRVVPWKFIGGAAAAGAVGAAVPALSDNGKTVSRSRP